jgi:hypothetical protein
MTLKPNISIESAKATKKNSPSVWDCPKSILKRDGHHLESGSRLPSLPLQQPTRIRPNKSTRSIPSHITSPIQVNLWSNPPDPSARQQIHSQRHSTVPDHHRQLDKECNTKDLTSIHHYLTSNSILPLATPQSLHCDPASFCPKWPQRPNPVIPRLSLGMGRHQAPPS